MKLTYDIKTQAVSLDISSDELKSLTIDEIDKILNRLKALGVKVVTEIHDKAHVATGIKCRLKKG